MKEKRILLVIIGLVSSLVIYASNDSTYQYRADSNLINIANRIEQKVDSLILQIQNNEFAFQYEKPFPFIYYLIPILVALIAGMIALWQVKANIISSARINWTENLRKALSELIGEVEILNFEIRQIKIVEKEKSFDAALKLYNEKILKAKKPIELSTRIKLYLNSKHDSHRKLEDLVNDLINRFTLNHKASEEINDLDFLLGAIVKQSKSILKESWEDAKTFRLRDIFKIKY